jgi:hypothetical protein
VEPCNRRGEVLFTHRLGSYRKRKLGRKNKGKRNGPWKDGGIFEDECTLWKWGMKERLYILSRKDIDRIVKKCFHPYWETCGGLNSCEFFEDGKCLFEIEKFISLLPEVK